MRVAYVNADCGIPVFGDKGACVHIQEIIRAMGYEPRREEAEGAAGKRRAVLDELEAGRITAEEAMRELRES